MTYKIEDIAVSANPPSVWGRKEFEEFVRTAHGLRKNQSFFRAGLLPSHYRVALSVLHYALERRYITRTEKGGMRIGRLS